MINKDSFTMNIGLVVGVISKELEMRSDEFCYYIPKFDFPDDMKKLNSLLILADKLSQDYNDDPEESFQDFVRRYILELGKKVYEGVVEYVKLTLTHKLTNNIRDIIEDICQDILENTEVSTSLELTTLEISNSFKSILSERLG